MQSVLNALSGLVFGGDSGDGGALTGSLHERVPAARSFRQTYLTATAEVGKTTTAHQSTLNIMRSEDEDTDDDDIERSFLIDESMNVYAEKTDDGNIALFFRGKLPNDAVAEYYFEVEPGKVGKLEALERNVLRAVYERKYGRDATGVAVAELERLRGSRSRPMVPLGTPVAKPAAKATSATSTPASAGSSRAAPHTTGPVPKMGSLDDDAAGMYTLVSSAAVKLLRFDGGALQYVPVSSNATIAVHKLNTGNFDFKLSITVDGNKIEAPLDSQMVVKFPRSATVEMSLAIFPNAYGVKFKNADERAAFAKAVMKAWMEHARHETVPDDDCRMYLPRAIDEDEDGEQAADDDNEDVDEEEEQEEDRRRIRQGTRRDDGESDYSTGRAGQDEFKRAGAEHNSQLAVGASRTERVFVMRGNMMGLFRANADNELQFELTRKDLKARDGSPLKPVKVMMHQQDASMLAVNSHDQRQISRIDMETGKVVEEYSAGESSVVDIAPVERFAQATNERTFSAISGKALFKIDPLQASGGKVQDGSLKAYSSNMGFTSLATTSAGEVVIGDTKGQLRLFNKYATNAKTQLPGFGDAILGVDVSADGKWILATCATYILLFPAEHPEEPQKTGFSKPLGVHKPRPIRLELTPEHKIKLGSDKVSFTPARFDKTANGLERSIVTSTGPHVITWNFRQVKQGNVDRYRIHTHADSVVQSQFLYGQSRAVAVALPDDVSLDEVKQFSLAPNVYARGRASMGGRTRDDIVNSPH